MAQTAETRVRMAPEARKTLIRTVAREVFAERGYAATGLAEIAERGQVSKTLLYHYFPDGRPELLVAVMDDVLTELMAETRAALAVPFGVNRKIEGLVDTFMSFLERNPDAFRLLFREPWGSGEPRIIRRAVEAQVQLATELISPLASSGAPGPVLLAATSGTVGLLLATAELLLAGQVDREVTVATASRYIIGGLAQLGS